MMSVPVKFEKKKKKNKQRECQVCPLLELSLNYYVVQQPVASVANTLECVHTEGYDPTSDQVWASRLKPGK